MYSTFLMYNLAVSTGVIDSFKEYDLAWSEADALREQFEASFFNVDSKSEYDCLVNFLKSLPDYKKYKTPLIILNEIKYSIEDKEGKTVLEEDILTKINSFLFG